MRYCILYFEKYLVNAPDHYPVSMRSIWLINIYMIIKLSTNRNPFDRALEHQIYINKDEPKSSCY
jgi:hypothetical protein